MLLTSPLANYETVHTQVSAKNKARHVNRIFTNKPCAQSLQESRRLIRKSLKLPRGAGIKDDSNLFESATDSSDDSGSSDSDSSDNSDSESSSTDDE